MTAVGSSGPRSTLASLAVRCCLDWQEQFSWPDRAAGYTAVATWRSRTSEFVRCAALDGRGRDVVVKVILRGTVIAPEDQYRASRNLSEVLASAPVDAGRAAPALGWSADPPAVVFDHVAGRDLPALLLGSNDGDPPPWPEVLHRCGAALGAWHASLPAEDRATTARVRADVRRLARKQGIRPAHLALDDTEPWLARRYRDFSVHNVRVTDSGDVVLLDPPAARVEHDLPHRDLAWFTSSLEAHLTHRRHGSTTGGDDPPVRRVLVPAFLAGHEAATGRVLTPADHTIIAVFEGAFLLGRARRLARERALGRARACTRRALAARRRAVRRWRGRRPDGRRPPRSGRPEARTVVGRRAGRTG